jgi:CheY-like chemotaxis protein
VTDTGIGIGPDQINNLFTPFEQADSSTTRNFGGTGLGLAITKRIVELMAGQIRVRSQPGIGSTFEVRIPFEPAPVHSTPSPAQGALPGPGGNRFAEMKILAAEDGEVNRFVLEAFLRSEGTVPVMVVNGVQAVEQIAENGPDAFDLVLMDIQMPEMDGYEAARRIVDMAPGLPIVGQTAHALAEDRARCLAAGMVDYIAKPIELEKLAEVILRHTQPRTRRAC